MEQKDRSATSVANQDILQKIADLGEVAHPFPQQEDMAEEVEVEAEASMVVVVTMVAVDPEGLQHFRVSVTIVENGGTRKLIAGNCRTKRESKEDPTMMLEVHPWR